EDIFQGILNNLPVESLNADILKKAEQQHQQAKLE
ncbi:MAG: hypothetical protein RL637_1646, partial [Pseudomonadota bacterium]